MIQFTTIKRLMYALDNIHEHRSVMEDQITKTRDRLNAGVDLDGKPFLPYMTRRPYNHVRPLVHAAKLYDDVRYGGDHNHTGFELKATITGQAAKIAVYQNVKRRFVGFSKDDREEAGRDLLDSMREMMGQWR